ncbi:tRNA (guanosine(37)-N1)-methyltransferase TrmD [Nocardioides sp. zg-1228]|uniref:tRNA (guanosine(37)-N1)-methyltransferase TrmD n=1 Tax=Nocardioides sp. zg-1228 TaxID=2763008 RepID=UPI0016432DAC|nr:tRNA (guanosine(37)-N1)-methyltransferase TrmD [Nocardioides sp. zg-1228]MBC2933376.1 tRNA (guanosine(37)-N1)-methyltransferase TrmD [Nocardioides sp. zg-1228]QSF56467.1 tRNA (guanosine(37)-N1)-methyltransferase TrmD [Nocardioides sp. zg-1228]
MRIDVVTIFPDYLAPLGLSLPGKAQDRGLLDVAVHDLRQWTTDRHRTVDDTPYGGGAGMVMKPEPWGRALDAVAAGATIVFTTPSGEPFTQALAHELSGHEHLVFACGRYEGIDQRVIEHAATVGTVREVSLGDYVLNGGEVAALAITEAVVRLLPGFMGNAESLVEESHADGLLEYPVYTKPASWQGREVPEVLLSGDHARIEAWRREQAVHRTAERRPDLLRADALVGALGELDVRPAVPADAGELYTLQRACWLQELEANPGVEIPALRESLDDVRRGLGEWTVMVAREPSSGRLVGAVRGRLDSHGEWDIGRIMVAPDLQGRGLGRALLELVEGLAPPDATTYVLFTGAGSTDNLRMYKKAGFRLRADRPSPPGAVVLTKQVRRRISR